MFKFLLAVGAGAVVVYFVGAELWNAGLIFRVTSGLWAPAMLVLSFAFFARLFRLEG
ncbi:hypothetical protein GTO10_02175 [Candidatus Saccharibacteria bacterium]|nr:hypothetical protein [Candidatus Saccharibacteria bacterium]